MEKSLIFATSITIDADKEKVWEALTSAELTPKYMYGCVAVTNWEVGSTLLWNAEYEGEVKTFVKGYVKVFNPFKMISYSVFDPNAGIEDVLENYLTTTYVLNGDNGKTKLDVSQGDYAIVEKGKERFEHAEAGWTATLNALKELIETLDK